MKSKAFLLMLILALLVALLSVSGVTAQGPQPQGVRAALGTAFTYQGQLKSGGNPVNGSCDFRFALFDAAAAAGIVLARRLGCVKGLSAAAALAWMRRWA